ncbi:MAG: lytic transglycosylase domain-containing protein [Armatimonadetes bacterium]|nr:lytic transglycosylase domain-containing protein [Armatimonadota bacterium]
MLVPLSGSSGLTAMLSRVLEIEQALQHLDGPTAATNSTASDTGATVNAAPADFAQVLSRARAAGSAPAAQTDRRFSALIAQAAARYGVDEDLVHAVVQAESDYNPTCRSHCGAMGLMQLMPGTARGLGVGDAYDPAQNIDGGVRYLRQQLNRFKEVDLAVAAYNAGPGAVQRHDGVPPYRETQAYVKRVMQTLWQRKGQ